MKVKDYRNNIYILSLALAIFFCFVLSLMHGNAVFASNSAREPKSDQTKLSAVKHTDYFVFHYDPSDPYLARRIETIAQSEMLRVAKDLSYKPSKSDPFIVYIYAVHYDFIKAGGLLSQEFTVGITGGEHEEISVDASGSFDQPQTILAHEITHAIIFRLLGQNITALPLWFNEGMAKYESGRSDSTDRILLADAASEGTLLHLSELRESFPKKYTGLSYAQSASAIEFLVKKYGKFAPRRVLEKLASSGSFNNAMHLVTGKTADEFDDEWFTKISKSYATVRILKVITAIISVVMAILAIMAFFTRRKQKIEAAKKWDQEEFEEALRRQMGNDWSK